MKNVNSEPADPGISLISPNFQKLAKSNAIITVLTSNDQTDVPASETTGSFGVDLMICESGLGSSTIVLKYFKFHLYLKFL